MERMASPKGQPGAVCLLIHGFIGGDHTFGDLPRFLAEDPDLAGYDIRPWSYPSSINPVKMAARPVWSADPDIGTIGQALRTELECLPAGTRRIVLAGHSMGGLVIQAFVIAELLAGRRTHLDRITEVVFMGTPSGGLSKASWFRFLSRQIENMATDAAFIRNLRTAWTAQVDARRAEPEPPTLFRVTAVAGLSDTFVPQESSLHPFPFDDQELVPGDHRAMVKPANANQVIVRLLKSRLTRGTLTAEERRLIEGRSEDAVRMMDAVRAASALDDVPRLREIAADIERRGPHIPKVWRELGLALLRCGEFGAAAEWLTRYRGFEMHGTRPFEPDVPAVQQLAIALEGSGRRAEAVALLRRMLDEHRQDHAETTGILAGRIKRQWRESPGAVRLGYQALRLYREALDEARRTADDPQIVYNGINTATLMHALGEAGHDATAREVLEACGRLGAGDYWAAASRGEAHLLLGEYPAAETAYRAALALAPGRRDWGSTALQALDILRRLGQPPGTERLRRLLESDLGPQSVG